MDEHVTCRRQLREDDGPVVLITPFTVAPEDAGDFIEAWADDAAFMKQQPGFIPTQLHQGTTGSTTFVNARAARYPASTVAAPHVFKKVAVPGICVA